MHWQHIFSKHQLIKKNYNEMLKEHPNIPKIKIKIYLNKTRIEAHCLLDKSSLRIKRNIKYCEIEHQLMGFPSDGEWKELRVIEGVLHGVHPI